MAELAGRARRVLAGIRARVLVWYVVLFAVSVIVALFVIRRVLYIDVEDGIDAQLSQEVAELQLLADGLDPETGERFGNDVTSLFETFVDSNVPAEGEVFVGLVDGEIVAATPVTTARELLVPELGSRWTDLTAPLWGEDGVTGTGAVRWLAVPVFTGEGDAGGVFVVASLIGAERDEIDEAVRVMAIVSTVVLVVASLLGWATAGRVLSPLRQVTTTARRISEEDLSERIPTSGDDEVAVMTRTFNDMLDRLEAAFADQRAFLDDLGHELRTPITIVMGQLELLPEDSAERDEVIAICLDELERMNREVNDLITLAKSGRPDFLRESEVDLAELTVGLVPRAQAIDADRRWVVASVAPVTVHADADRLVQALVNLLSNAAQHTSPGDEIRLGSRVTDAGVELWVTDTGVGIAPEDRERIFERFGRGEDALLRRREGAGLGLAIVSAIAGAHGGDVRVASEVGQGSTFTILLPTARIVDGDELIDHDDHTDTGADT